MSLAQKSECTPKFAIRRPIRFPTPCAGTKRRWPSASTATTAAGPGEPGSTTPFSMCPAPNWFLTTASGPHYTDLYGSTWRVDLRPWHMVEPAIKVAFAEGLCLPRRGHALRAGLEGRGPPLYRRATATTSWSSATALARSNGHGRYVVSKMSWPISPPAPTSMQNLIEQVTDHQLAIVERLLELPVDGIMFSDDWGYQKGVLIGAERWRRLLKPHLARLYDRVHAGRARWY